MNIYNTVACSTACVIGDRAGYSAWSRLGEKRSSSTILEIAHSLLFLHALRLSDV